MRDAGEHGGSTGLQRAIYGTVNDPKVLRTWSDVGDEKFPNGGANCSGVPEEDQSCQLSRTPLAGAGANPVSLERFGTVNAVFVPSQDIVTSVET